MLDEIDKIIIEYANQNPTQIVPIVMSKELNIDKRELVTRLRKLLEDGFISTSNEEKQAKNKDSNIVKKKAQKLNEIDKKILQYLENKESTTEIAAKLGVSRQYISVEIKKMREQGVEIPDKSAEIDRKILEGLERGETRRKIGEDLGLSKASVGFRIAKMRENGIEIKIPDKIVEIDRKILEGLGQGKTQIRIAEELGLPVYTIMYRIKRMREQGIEIPDKSPEIDRKILEGLAQGKTQIIIGEELGISNATVSTRIKKMQEQGIEIPDQLDETNNKIIEKLTEKRTVEEIGEELGLSEKAIRMRILRMRRNGIEIPEISNESAEINRKILEGLAERKKTREIAEELELSESAVESRIERMKKKGVEIPRKHRKANEQITIKIDKKDEEMNRQLANGIITLIKTRHATIEQIRIIGDYYGVDIVEILDSLDDIER